MEEKIRIFKIPIIFGSLGLILLILSLFLLLKNQEEKSDVEFFSAESTPSANTKLKVDVQGAVMTPGVYNLNEGARVVDALASAGGLSGSADRNYIAKYVNRAAKLADGQKIYIPSTVETVEGKTQNEINNSGKEKLNINTASQGELEALPGVGPVTAGKIISGRPYQTADELKSKKIVGSSVYNKIKDLIVVY